MFKKDTPACLSETVSTFEILMQLGLEKAPVSIRTRDFLLSRQLEDGGWDENPELLQFDPPPWDKPGEIRTRTWLSAEILRQLARNMGKGDPRLEKANNYLQENFDGQRIVGYKIASAIALGAISLTSRWEGKKYEALLGTVREYSASETDPAFLAWLIDCYADAGFDHTDESVRDCLNKLESSQEPDGAWRSEDGDHWTVNTTINALRCLKWGRRW